MTKEQLDAGDMVEIGEIYSMLFFHLGDQFIIGLFPVFSLTPNFLSISVSNYFLIKRWFSSQSGL